MDELDGLRLSDFANVGFPESTYSFYTVSFLSFVSKL